MPPNPNTPAMMATTKKNKASLSIASLFARRPGATAVIATGGQKSSCRRRTVTSAR